MMENLKMKLSSRSSAQISRVLLHPKTMNALRIGASEPLWIFINNNMQQRDNNDLQPAAVGISWPSVTTSPDQIDLSGYLHEIIGNSVESVSVCRVDDCLYECRSITLTPISKMSNADQLLANPLFIAFIRNQLLSIKYLKDQQVVSVTFAGVCYRFQAGLTANKDAPQFPRYYFSNLESSTAAAAENYKISEFAQVFTDKTEFKVNTHPQIHSSSSHQPAAAPDYCDIGGLKQQIEIVRETIELPLHHPEIYSQFGLRPPKGILLYGPPGTGKTLIARIVSAQTKASFFVLNGAELMSKFVGETESRIRDIFREAREKAPSVVFIDEMDSLCPKRDDGNTGETEKRIVATLLTLIDGLSFTTSSSSSSPGGSLESNGNVVVLAATNRPNAIDAALRRPGRFDKEVEIGVPNPAERLEILKIHLRKIVKNISDDELKQIADCTHGYVGADVAAIVREAGMFALKRWQKLNTNVDRMMSKLSLTAPSSTLPTSSTDIDNKKDDKKDVSTPVLTFTDLVNAKAIVRPSAMREITVQVPQTKWDDIGGMHDQKQILQESIVYPLKYPQTFHRFGMSPPKGILMYGPPGCSKTLLAKALATEAEHNFFLIKAGEIFSPFVGESERTIREIFRKAKVNAPSIIFFDEIDALALKRSSSSGDGGSKVGDRVLTTLLTEMDGVETLEHVFVVAATNRPDVLDPALMRPGRFDRMVYVSPPDGQARLEILRMQQRKMNFGGDVNVERLADLTNGWTGAEIVGLCREAALSAIREDPKDAASVCQKHFQQAFQQSHPQLTDEILAYYRNFASKGR